MTVQALNTIVVGRCHIHRVSAETDNMLTQRERNLSFHSAVATYEIVARCEMIR